MELFLTIVSTLILGIPLVVGLIIAFCIMFDEVFDTRIGNWIYDYDIFPKGLAVSVMLLILSLPVFGICYFLGILN